MDIFFYITAAVNGFIFAIVTFLVIRYPSRLNARQQRNFNRFTKKELVGTPIQLCCGGTDTEKETKKSLENLTKALNNNMLGIDDTLCENDHQHASVTFSDQSPEVLNSIKSLVTRDDEQPLTPKKILFD